MSHAGKLQRPKRCVPTEIIKENVTHGWKKEKG